MFHVESFTLFTTLPLGRLRVLVETRSPECFKASRRHKAKGSWSLASRCFCLLRHMISQTLASATERSIPNPACWALYFASAALPFNFWHWYGCSCALHIRMTARRSSSNRRRESPRHRFSHAVYLPHLLLFETFLTYTFPKAFSPSSRLLNLDIRKKSISQLQQRSSNTLEDC